MKIIFPPKSLAAFTLVEMIVSIAIIALISTIFLANYRTGIRRSDLSMSTNVLAADVRLAQSYSLGLTKFNGVFPAGGWGVFFDLSYPDRYYIFADNYDVNCNSGADQTMNASDGANHGCNRNSQNELSRTVMLPASVRITGLQIVGVDNSYSNPPQLAVTFVPPRPQTMICQVSGNGNQTAVSCPGNTNKATITLTNTQDNTTMQLYVNSLGLIDTSQ